MPLAVSSLTVVTAIAVTPRQLHACTVRVAVTTRQLHACTVRTVWRARNLPYVLDSRESGTDAVVRSCVETVAERIPSVESS